MSKKKYDAIVYIGRFEPFHNGHANTILHAARLADRVIILIGSANEPRTFKNPFTYGERANVISDWINEQEYLLETTYFHYHGIENYPYSEESWVQAVQTIVNYVVEPIDKPKIAIIGHKKDGSSYYLDMFPQWTFIDEPLVEPLDATSIRDIYFSDKCNLKWFEGVLPKETIKFLERFRVHKIMYADEPNYEEIRPEYAQICRERAFLKEHKKQYEHLRYPPVFVTVDAVVLQAGHVLMIKRRAEPGKGLWALPGGYLNAATDKSIEDAMIRELHEETLIKVPPKVLRGSIKEVKVFDAIDRSERGRIITHAHKVVLNDVALPKVKGSDDAEKARWVPFADVKREECFEDHYSMIQYFIGR